MVITPSVSKMELYPYPVVANMSTEVSPRLSESSGFSEEDLSANRQKSISAAQKKKLDSLRQIRLIALIAYVGLIVLFILGCILGSMYLFLTHQDPSFQIAIPLSIGVVTLIMSVAAINYFLRTRDLLTHAVSAKQGPAHLYSRNYSDGDRSLGTGWFLKLGGKEFRLQNQVQYHAIKEGKPYKVYFIQSYPIHYILSVEPS